ncbi:MAG: hypothetical protein ABW022_08485 [Actinoplanes sp.]
MTTAATLLLAVLLACAFAAAWYGLAHLDTRLEEPMPSLRDHIRRYLGTYALPRMEHRMTTVSEALTRLTEQVNRVSAAQATSFSNLQNAIAELKRGDLTAEQQALVDQIETSLTTLADDAQRADDGHEPVEEPTQPAPVEEPVDVQPATPDDTVQGEGTARR